MNYYTNKKGISLVETLMAVGIFAIFATTFFIEMLSFDKFEGIAFYKTTATKIVVSEMEILNSTSFNQLLNIANNYGGKFALKIQNGVISAADSNSQYIINNLITAQNKMQVPPNITGTIYVYIDKVPNSYDYLLDIYVSMSFKVPNKQIIIGEDKNLNGILELAEDVNGNGKSDSPISLSTSIRNPL